MGPTHLQLRFLVVLLGRRLGLRDLSVVHLLCQVLQSIHRVELELHVALDHHLLERDKVIDRQDLLEDLLSNIGRPIALHELEELLGRHAELLQHHLQERLHRILERAVHLEVRVLVLLQGVEHHAVLVDEVPHRQRPLRALQELRHRLEDPRPVLTHGAGCRGGHFGRRCSGRSQRSGQVTCGRKRTI